MQRTTLGDFELTVVSDGTYLADGGAFFGVVPKTLWSRRVTADEKNLIAAGLNSLLVRTGAKNILVETGMGNKMPDKLVQIYGQPAKLLDNLHAIGLAPEDIDIVINSHLHFDHCGWNTVRRGDRFVATFPKAKYYVQRGEWEHARLQLERDAVSYMSPNYDPLVESGQMELLDGDREIVPGVSVKVFPGHTANMQAVIVSSTGFEKERFEGARLPRGPQNARSWRFGVEEHRESQGLGKGTALAVPTDSKNNGALAPEGIAGQETGIACYISDLIPTSAHLDITWVMAFDLYPLQTIESRKKYYTRAIPERWLTVFTHDDKTPWGYVDRGEKGKLIARAV